MIATQPSTEQTDALLLGYAMEGIRLAGTFGSYREAVLPDTVVEDDGRKVPIEAKDKVFVSFVSTTSLRAALVMKPGDTRTNSYDYVMCLMR